MPQSNYRFGLCPNYKIPVGAEELKRSAQRNSPLACYPAPSGLDATNRHADKGLCPLLFIPPCWG